MKITNELIILYHSNEDTMLKEVIANTCKSLSRSAKLMIRKSIREIVIDEKPEFNQACRDVHFANGSKMVILAIAKDSSSFDIAESLRFSFAEELKESKNISYNIQCLSESHQEICAKLISIMEVTAPWCPPSYKTDQAKKDKPKISSGFYTTLSKEKIDAIMSDGEHIGRANNLCRHLAYLPPNILNCRGFMEEIIGITNDLVINHSIEMEFFDYNDLKKMGAGLFCAVSQGDLNRDSFIARLSYVPKKRSKNRKRICIIGKGIVYDTGGLNSKGDEMAGMHRDMTGAAVAISTFRSIIHRGLDVEVDCYLPISDNKISHESYRQSDIITSLSGSTVEVTDTDAEGRFVLADSITLAKNLMESTGSKKEFDLFIDFATLTGGAIDAVGGKMACAFSNKKELLDLCVEVGDRSSERVWGFPILKSITKSMKSDTLADIKQDCEDPCAHIIGAAFLDHFYKDSPFIHIDLACEKVDNGLGIIDTDVNGFGVIFANSLLNEIIKK